MLSFTVLIALQSLSAQTTNWTSFDGTFGDIANWDNGVPTTGVDANIATTNGGSAFTVSVSGDTSQVMNNLNLSSADAILSIQARRYANSWITVEGDFLNSGTVQLTNGDGYSSYHTRLHVDGLFTNSGTFRFVNSGHTPHYYGNLINNGTVSVEDTASYISKNGATGSFVNNSAFNVTSGAVLHIDGTDETFVQAAGTLDNQGTINLTNADFEYTGGDITGNALRFYESTDLSLNHTGTGDFTFYRSSHNFEGNVEAAQALNIYVSRYNHSFLTSADSFRNSGTINFIGDGYSGYTSRIYMSSGTLTNDGTINWNNTGHYPRFYGNLLNNGTFNIYDDQAYFYKVGDSATFTNTGDFTIHSGADLDISGSSETFIQEDGTLTNSGNFDITNGAFEYRGGAIAGNPLRFWDNTRLLLDHDGPGSFTFYRASHTLEGDVAADQNLHLYVTRYYHSYVTSADGFINDGSILFSGGSYSGYTARIYLNSGALTNNGSITWNNSGHIPRLYGDLVNNGSFDIYDDQAYFYKVGESGTFENHGNFTIHSGADLDITQSGETFVQIDGTLANDGRFDITNGAFTYDGGSISGNTILFWDNSTLNLNHDGPGSFLFYRSSHTLNGDVAADQSLQLHANRYYHSIVTQTADFENAGTILFTGGSYSGYVSRLYAPSQTITNSGTIQANDSGHIPQIYGNLINSGAFRIDDTHTDVFGSLTNADGGVLQGTGLLDMNGVAVVNDGRLSPGNSVGTLTINNSVQNSSTSELFIEIDSTGTDLMTVQGTYNIAGDLIVDFLDSFVPSATDSYTILNANALTGAVGDFENVDDEGLVSVPGGFMRLYISGNSLVLSAFSSQAEPDPAADVDFYQRFASVDQFQTVEVVDNEQTATVSAERVLIEGNPREFWQVSQNFGPANLFSAAELGAFSYDQRHTWDPSYQGAITTIDITLDVQLIDDLDGLGISVAPALVQDGIVYIGTPQVVTTLSVWSNLNFTGLVATDFSNQGSHPDFSATANPLTFGFYSSNDTTGAAASSTIAGYDNLFISINEVAATPGAGVGAIKPVSYDMLNGQSGSYSYVDRTYNGSGNNASLGAQLTDGLGQLTDGYIGSGNIVANFGNGNAYEWLGWSSITPVVTFDFGSIQDFSSLRFFLGRDLGRATGNVGIPDRITLEFGRKDAFGVVYYTDSFTHNVDEGIEYAWKSAILDVSADYEGQFVRVTLHDGDGGWIFLSEVEFFDDAGINYPSTIAYADFDAITGLYLGSNTSQSLSTGFQLGNALQLNPPADSKMGGIIFHEKQAVLDGFYSKFNFVISDIESSGTGGEGFSFHVHDEVNWNSGIGAVGRDGLTIQFDTYPQAGEADSTCRVYGRDSRLLAEVDLSLFSINLESGSAIEVEVFHNGQFLNVRIDGQWVITDVFAPTSEFAGSDGKARVGFSSQTVSDHESIYLLNWHFESGFGGVATLSSSPVNFPPVFDPFMGRLDASDGGRSPVFTNRALVELSGATPGTTIRYTVDGSEPDAGSTEYTAPLEFVDLGSHTLKAVAFGNGMAESPVATVEFEVLGDLPGRVVREYYPHQWGSVLDVLRNDPAFENQIPSAVELLETPEIPVNIGDYYGSRLMGYVEAPVSGNYTFFVASDNQGELLLSTDEDPANAIVVASVPTSSGSRAWTTHSSQASAPVALVAGERYYFEARQIEGSGSDNLAVGWQLPDATYERPIASNRVFAYGAGNAFDWRPVEFSVLGGVYDSAVSVGLSHPDAGASIYYTTDGSVPTESDTLYAGSPIAIAVDTQLKARAFTASVPVSGVAVADYKFDSSAAFTRSGLTQWYRADTAVDEGASGVSRWSNLVGDHSDYGFYQYNASQQPGLIAGAANGHPAVRFDGANDGLIGDSSTFTGSPYTVFVVYQRLGNLGRTIQSRSANWLLGLHSSPGFYANGWVGNGAPSAGDLNVWNLAVGSRDSEAQYLLNGMNYTLSKSPSGDPGLLALGGGEGTYNEPVNADIAEILVFDRELSLTERQEIERYLSSRYTLFTPQVEAPEMSLAQGSYSGSQTVSLSSVTPGASIYFTLDGSIPTSSSTLYSSPISLSATTTVKAIAIKGSHLDSPVSARTYRIDEASSPISMSDLSLWLDAAHGLTMGSDQRVVSWEDLSGNAHEGSTVGYTKQWQPLYSESAVNGLPAVDFDDASLRFESIDLQSPSTVFVVYQPKSTGGYILSGSDYWRLGQSGSGSDFVSGNTVVGSGAPLNIGEANVAVAVQDTSTSEFYFNGVDYTFNSAVSGGAGQLTLGGKLGRYTGASDAYVAEVIVYDRALSITDRIAVEQYLAAKYAAFTLKVATPVVETPSGYSANPVDVTLSCADPDAEIRYTTDGSIPSESSTLYTAPFTLNTITELKVRAFRSGLEASDLATGYFEIGSTATEFTSNGLQLWLRADRGMSLTTGEESEGRVLTWNDLSGNGHNATVPGFGRSPQLVSDGIGGQPAIQFDGIDDGFYVDPALSIGRPATFFIVFARTGTVGRILQSASGANWLLGTYSNTMGFYANGWVRHGVSLPSNTGYLTTGLQTSSSSHFYVNGDDLTSSTAPSGTIGQLAIGGALGTYNEPSNALISEIIVFDRDLDETERREVEAYLANKYSLYTPRVPTPIINPASGRYTGSVSVSLASPVIGSSIRYTTDGSDPTATSTLYSEPFTLNSSTDLKVRSFASGYGPSTIVEANYIIDEALPIADSGLALWLDSTRGLAIDSKGEVERWADLSGNGYDAFQLGSDFRPEITTDGGNSLVHFANSSDGMKIDADLNIAGDYTAFVVYRRTGSNSGDNALVKGNGVSWFVGPYSNVHGFYNASAWISPSTVQPAQDVWYVSTARLSDGKSSYHRNGENDTVAPYSLRSPGNLALGFEGNRGGVQNYDLAELIVYDRGLTEAERLEVESYLAGKWSLAMIPEPPTVSPRPGHYNEPVDVTLTPTLGTSTIRYTLDGSAPDINSTLYTGAIPLTDDTVVKAVEVSAGGEVSPVITSSYLISASETGHAYVEYFGGVYSTAISAFVASPDYPDSPQSYELLTSLATPVNRGSYFSSWVRGYIHPPQTGDYTFAVSSDDSSEFYLSTDDDPANMQLIAYLNGSASAGAYGNSVSQNQPVALVAGQRYYFEARVVENSGGDHLSVQWQLPDTTIEAPISGQYLSPFGLTDEPSKLVPATISPIGAVYSGSVSVTVTHPKPSVELRYTLDGSEPSISSSLYSAPILVSSAATVKVKAFRAGFTESQTAEVSYDFDAGSQFVRDGLHMWYRADRGVTDSSGAVSDWLNLANFGHSASQGDTDKQPLIVASGFNGEPVIRFDGTDDRLDFTSTPLSEFTVAVVFSADSTGGWGGPLAYGTDGVDGFSIVNGINSTTSYQSELVTYPGEAIRSYSDTPIALPFDQKVMVWDSSPTQSLDGLDQNLVSNGPSGWGTPSSSIGFSYAHLDGDIAEILIFDRVLSDQERGELELYLADRYAQTLTLDEPTVSPGAGLYESEVEVSFEHAGPSVELRYTLDGSDPTVASTLYNTPFTLNSDTTVKVAAFRAGATPSAVVEAQYLFDSDTSFSRSGLALWLRSDTGVELNGQGIESLSDLSGNGMDAGQLTAGSQPTLELAAINGEPVIRFDGTDDFLQMPSGFSDFSAGITAFVVAKTQDANSYARFFDLGSGQASNNIFLAREATSDNFLYEHYLGSSSQGSVKAVDGISADVTTIFGVVHDVSSVATILKNGVGQATSVFNLPAVGTRSSNFIGRSNWSADGYFSGDIAEVMIFDRALSFAERETVSDYLRNRYGIASQTVARPAFNQNPGFYAGSVDVTVSTGTPNARLYYTLDGSIPDESSTLYTGPVTLTQSTELTVRGFRAGFNPSPIRSGLFTVGDLPADGDGLAAVYYDNLDFTGTTVRRLDPIVNFDWGTGSPASLISADSFSAIWEGQVQSQFSETYTFIVESDDGVRLTVDGNVVIDHLVNGVHRLTADVALVKGQKYDIKLDYYENTGGAKAGLRWSSFSQAETVIPSTQLFSGLSHVNTVRTPSASPDSGTFPNQVSVTLLTGTPGATIYYTTDGSEPTTSSAVYSSSVLLTSDATLKAMATAPGFNPSGTIIRSYVVDNSGPALSNPLFNGSALLDGMAVNDSGTIAITATDSGSVSRVEFYVEDAPGGNSVLLKADTSGLDGYNAQWNADLTPSDGIYQIRIVAFDSFNTPTELLLNVNLQLDPPPAPVITSPASGIVVANTLISVSGTAESNTSLVPVVNNVARTNPTLIGASGSFTRSVTLQSGVNSIAARTSNRAGDSALSNVVNVEIDNTLPDAPPGFKAESRLGGRVRLSWLAPSSSNTSHYRVYRSETPFADSADATLLLNNFQNVLYDDVPPTDGTYYYAIVTVNAAGSVSLLSPVLQAVSDRSGPKATSIVLTHENANLQSGTRLGVGTVDLILTVNEPLGALPFLSVNPGGSSSTVVPLIKIDGTSYRGSFGISDTTADGTATITYSGRDIYGNAGSVVQAGGTWYFDTAGPVVTLLDVLSPEIPILNNDSEEVSVSLFLSEAPEGVPTFNYYMSEALDTTPIPLTLTPGADANEWVVTFDLPADAGIIAEDYVVFGFEGMDSFGNTSDTIDGDNAFLVYQGTLPGLSASGNFYGVALPGGDVELNWLPVEGASGYRIYRSAVDQTALTALVDINDGATITFTDTPGVDGVYRYAIATLRTANSQVSEGSQSAPSAVTVDGTPPLPPSNLNLQLTSLGMAATWDRSPSEGGESITYALYRGADVPITAVSGQTLLAADLDVNAVTDPNPINSEPSYVVVAVDSIGNQSPISNSAFNNVGLLPVQNLKVFQKEGFQPFISWSAASIAVNGYEVTRGTQLLTTTTAIGYSDESSNGGAATYGVTVIDTNDARSLTRELLLPTVSFQRTSTDPVRRGLMNRVYYTITNTGDTDINNAILKVKLAGRTHQSTSFSVPAFGAQQVSLVLGGYSELSGNTAEVTESLEIRPNAGELVELQQTRSIGVSTGGISATVLGSDFRRGTNATASFTLYNPADELIEVVLARGGGSSVSDQVRFKLLDGATALATVPVQVSTGQGIVALSNGAVVLRLPAKTTYVSPDFEVPVPLNAPRNAQLQLQIDQVHSSFGKTEQVSLSGTEAISDVLITNVDYKALITDVTPENANSGELITIIGETRSTANDALLPNLPLTVVILHNGFERTFDLTSDGSGAFSLDFEPLENEAGRYQAWARHIDLNERSIQATFFVERLGINPTIYNLRHPRGVPFNIPVNVLAADGTSVTNLRAVYEASFQEPSPILPGGIEITPAAAVSIEGGGRATLSLGFLGDSDAERSGSIRIKLISDERPTDGWGFVTVNYTLTEGKPALAVSKSSFNYGGNPGENVRLELDLTNNGVVSAQDVQLALLQNDGGTILPAPSWISMDKPSALGNLGVGASERIGISLNIADDFPIGIYQYGLRIRSTNNTEILVPISLTVTNDVTGSVAFKILDIYTGEPDSDYVAPGTPEHPTPNFSGVSNVRIRLQNEIVTTQLFTGTTDGLGEYLFADIPAGRYRFRLNSDRHGEVSGRVTVQPGTIVTQTSQMQNQRVVVEWEVVPITIEDRYEILLTATFETEVPAPVVVVTPVGINLPAMCPGDVYNGEITIANYGLIRADDFVLPTPPTDDTFYYELLDAVPDTIEAGQVYIVPYRVTCLQAMEGNCEEDTIDDGEPQSSGGCSYRICSPFNYTYDCENGLSYEDGGQVCWVASGRGCGSGGSGGGGYYLWGGGIGGGGGYGSGGGGGGWSPPSSPLPNQPPDCECDPDPCCEEKGK